MDVMKYKYKAHRFINNIFYFIVFAIGFVVGLFFNGLTKVSAYTIYNDSKINVDEEFIYNAFSKNDKFNLDEYPYILCSTSQYNFAYRCIAINESLKNNLFFRPTSGTNSTYTISSKYPNINSPFSYFSFYYRKSGAYNSYSSVALDNIEVTFIEKYITQDNINFFAPNSISDISTKMFSNFSDILVTTSTSYSDTVKNEIKENFKKTNVLDFDQFKKLEMNDPLFDDDNNFKKVCVNVNDTFAITKSDCINKVCDENGENCYCYFYGSDFIFFKNGVTGLDNYIYDNSFTENLNTNMTDEVLSKNKFEYDETDEKFGVYKKGVWFSSKFVLNSIYDLPNKFGDLLKEKGYTNKNSYYGYTAYPFTYYFNQHEEKFLTHDTHEEKYRSRLYFNVFSFKELGIKENIECDNSHGDAGRPLDDDDYTTTCDNGYLTKYPDKYCFYIKKDYDVNILHSDGLGTDFGSVTTPWGNINVDTSLGEFEYEEISNSLMNNVITFLNRIKSTIVFINSNIYDFYNSMPVLVRMFILTILTILFVKLVIDMILR